MRWNRNVFATLSGAVVRGKVQASSWFLTAIRLAFGIGIGNGIGIDSNNIESVLEARRYNADP
jgi:hypothetical protein